MSSRWKRNVTVVVTLALVCAGVALNWKYSGREAADAAQEAGTKILGEATLVSSEEGALLPSEEEKGTDYFSSARLTRRQARDSAIALLQEAAQEEDASAAVANQASESIQVLAGYTLKEAQIENLVTAKGYEDCVVFMGEDAISVVVATESGELTDSDVARITDIAVTESGYAPSAVRIMATN
ncbi:MAG: SpoIIIAH-like family protein [Oscillibacter sp.]|nr:SpoIIIAH-like family protein [Oscillibacter sp.]